MYVSEDAKELCIRLGLQLHGNWFRNNVCQQHIYRKENKYKKRKPHRHEIIYV